MENSVKIIQSEALYHGLELERYFNYVTENTLSPGVGHGRGQ